VNEVEPSMERSPVVSAVEKPRPSRFAWGVSLGVGIGAIAVVAVLAIAYVGIVYSFANRYGAASDSGPVKVTAVNAGRWFTVGPDGRGTVTGYSNSSGSGDEMFGGTIAYLELTAPGSVDGVVISHSVPIYIKKDTKLTVEGKDWRPWTGFGKSPAETLFGDSYEDDSPFFSRELTVVFHSSGNKLIADSIDASGEVLDGMLPWEE